jgi:hypothetical protein
MSGPSAYFVGALFAWAASSVFYLTLRGTELVVILGFGGTMFLMIGICVGGKVFPSEQRDADNMRQREKFAERMVAYSGWTRPVLPVDATPLSSVSTTARPSLLSAVCVAICIGSIVGITGGLLISGNVGMALLASGAGFFGLTGGCLAGVRHGRR